MVAAQQVKGSHREVRLSSRPLCQRMPPMSSSPLCKWGSSLVDDQTAQPPSIAPAGTAVFQYWTDLYQHDLLPQEVLTQGHRRAVELYQAGEVPLCSPTGAEFLSYHRGQRPRCRRRHRQCPPNYRRNRQAECGRDEPGHSPSPPMPLTRPSDFALYLSPTMPTSSALPKRPMCCPPPWPPSKTITLLPRQKRGRG
jgi:hypothetical protein